MLLFKQTEDEKVYDRYKSLAKHHLIIALHYAEQHRPFASMREFGAMCSILSMYSTVTERRDLWLDEDINTLLEKLYDTDFNGISFYGLQDIIIEEFEEVGENHVTFN